ncbi:putative ribonuclease H-like domain-containing protein [Tanacetum coccineum]
MLKNILAGMSISQGNNLRGFLECVDAKRFWEAIRTRFGGNANSKKMQKAVFKQQFEAFKISSSEGLEKGLWRTTEVEDGRDNLHYGYQLKNQLGDQEAQILAYSHAVKKLEAQLVTFQKQQLSLNEKLTFQANEIYEKDESIGTSLKLFVVLEIRDLKGKDKEKLRLRVVVNTGMGVGKSSMGQNDTGTNINSVRPRVNVVSSNVNTVRSRQPDHPLKNMVDRGIFDSGCSGHMTDNKDQLEDFEEFNGGFVTFRGSKGYISSKGKIKVGNLYFDSVSFVKELGHFNLFSISQNCDKQHKVLFTKTECLVVSFDFKMPDENQILLKVPRHHNMYSFDMKTPTPAKGFACLIAKGTSDESKLWHRRLGHINFKNLNKLVKGNLVRGLPSKVFKNDHTCVACHKGKQHRASCKAKLERLITEPLHTLHMDLFGPTSVKSINHASYCLVITDDCTRFSWVFFLASKDETSGILQNFIRQIENQLSHRVKIIRSDNGTEFKNRDMLEFCGNKGIKQEYSNARTPQKNGVAERMNRTLIEAARTMLADSLLPTTFWAEAVSTACYIFNRTFVVQKRVLKTRFLFLNPFEIVQGVQDLQDTFESSDDNTNVVNAPQEPFVGNQDPDENSSPNPPHIDHCCHECGDSLDGIFCRRCTCKSCGKGAHYGYNCPPKAPIISNPKPCKN